MVLKLRPHHIYCSFFTGFEVSGRSEEFLKINNSIKETLRKGNDEIVEFKIAPDNICTKCRYYDSDDKKCVHPQGGEEEVRKWDYAILRDLNIRDGSKFQLDRIRQKVRGESPLKFCIERCPYKKRGVCDPTSSNYLHTS
ncbi:hypothetical protein AKJ56_00660 [candidate division MSBL1 archaeon SCGC-AAA382N08]|uniref:Uncharacterized protein n=1 Tax=candidate division MSBL1 archaeon SCGC-AAA382N08 TaxID=1698285 RepID=A0A133VQG8_9EURY|nr:hypothetical protein AKJ56_00660 [candidate division MSBL1 archaeon SCGC-AAA382N08]